jgi:hypothetical protein
MEPHRDEIATFSCGSLDSLAINRGTAVALSALKQSDDGTID